MAALSTPIEELGPFLQTKLAKYSHLGSSYQFQPIAVETLFSLGPQSRVFVKELGRRIGLKTGERRSCRFLLQRLSVAIQRGNSVAVLVTL